MRRERLARAALRAFPATARAARKDEMFGTLLDANADSSNARFTVELIGIVRLGMLERSLAAARSGPLRVAADGFCLCAILLLALFLSAELGNRLRGFDPLGPWDPLSPWSLLLLSGALALALIGYDRLAGGTALIFVSSLVADPSWRDLSDSRRELMIIPLVCFLTLTLAPRRRSPDYRRLAWLAPTAAVGVASSTTDDPTAAILLLALLILVPLALLLFTTDPRLAIACSLAATTFGIEMAQDPGGPGVLGLGFLLSAPVVLSIAATRTRQLQITRP